LVGARVWLTWNDGVREHVQITAANRGDFYTYPVAPDWAGLRGSDGTAEPATEPIRIGHTSNANPLSHSNPFMYDRVVKLYEFTVHSMGNRTWYADQAPEFVNNWRAEGTWGFEYLTATPGITLTTDYWDASATFNPANTQVNGASALNRTRVWKTEEIPFQRGYPVLDFSRIMESGGAPSELVVIARIGSLEPNTVLPSPGTAGGNFPDNLVERHIRLDKFLQVDEVRVVQPGPDFIIFNDQFVGVEVLNTGALTRNEAATATLRRTTLFNLLRDNDVRFDIVYEDGEERRITWDEFQRNRDYFAWMTGRDMHSLGLYFGMGELEPYDPADPLSLEADLLIYDEDDPYWSFTIGYVGDIFGRDTHVVRATPRLPVFTFEGFRENEPVVRRGPNAQIDERLTMPDDIREITGLLEVLNARWQVWGDYAREGAPNRQRAIPLVAPMFQDTGSGIPLWPEDAWGRGVLMANWPLIVEWVDGAVTDEDEGTILIDVMGSRNDVVTNLILGLGPHTLSAPTIAAGPVPTLAAWQAANLPATVNFNVTAVSWDHGNADLEASTRRVVTVTLRAETAWLFGTTNTAGTGLDGPGGPPAIFPVTATPTAENVRVISNTFREIRIRFHVDVS
jgi:hypothetical protein